MQITVTPKNSAATKQETDFYVAIGETVATSMALSNSEGTPLNLTGYSLKSEIATPSPITLTSSNGGIVITNASAGTITYNISSSVTTGIPAGIYSYDMFLTSPTSVETLLISGKFVIIPAITPVP